MRPELPGYRVGELIGEGGCGRVWAGEDPLGNPVAIRTFNALSTNIDLIRQVGRRLDGVSHEGHGPVPIWLRALDLRPAMEVMPLLADEVEGQLIPRNLQVQLADYLATSGAESLVKCLAKALATLHRHQVVHGNLKPANVFISEEGRVLVGDYGLGWMPGIDVLGFSDALLYMAPEQLRNPNGFYCEEGYRWDVFAFGVLAYRLLEGKFPRCHESFDDVAPAAGTLHKEGIEVDFLGVAQALAEEEMRPWQGEHDPTLKKMVERCLHLEPAKRFRDMVELCEVWERETLQGRHASEMEVVGRKLRSGRRWKRGLSWGLAASLACGTAAAIGWATREHVLAREGEHLAMEKATAEHSRRQALVRQEKADAEREAAQAELAQARYDLKELSRSREYLLRWAISEDGNGWPVLMGREGRLALLDQHYQALAASKGSLASEWQGHWQTERALLAIARHRPEEARELLANEVHRLGGEGLCRLLLQESTQRETARDDLELARNFARKESPPKSAWLLVILDFVEARSLERKGQPERALRLLADAAARVSQLPAVEPGTVSLWRTKFQREAAEVAEGAGRTELAGEFRTELVQDLRDELAAGELQEGMRGELAEQFVLAAEGLAELRYAQGEIAGARALATEALGLIPESARAEVRIALAVHHAVLAGCAREKGDTEAARQALETGLALLEEPSAESSHDDWRRYRQGMLKWQLSGVFGQANEAEQEWTVGLEALELMRGLLREASSRPSAIQVHHVIGYLSGDLARVCEANKNPVARNEYLDEAIESWKFLQAAHPEEPEYTAGLAWCERLKKP